MIRRWLVFLLLLLSASLTSAAREALSFISYEKATDVASDSFNVYCGTDKGLIIYRGAEGSFQYSGDPGDLLEGHHIYMIAAAEELGEVLAFTDRGIFRRLADDSWEKIGKSAGPVLEWGYDTRRISVRAKGGDYTWLLTRFELVRGLQVPVHPIHRKAPDFPPLDPDTGNPLEVVDYAELPGGDGVLITREGYLAAFSSSSPVVKKENGALFGSGLKAVLSDGEGGYWFVGTFINHLENGDFSFDRVPELADNLNDAVRASGRLWVATRSNGVGVYAANSFRSAVKMDAGLLDNNIISLRAEGEELYLLTKYGINSFNVRQPRKVREIRGIDFFNVDQFDVTEGTLILLHRDRLVLAAKDGTVLQRLTASSLHSDFLNTMARAGTRLYVGGNMGIMWYDIATHESGVVKSLREGVSDLLVREGRLYAATETGLYIIDLETERFKVLTAEDGLSSSRTEKLFAYNGYVLAVTSKGMNLIP
ncbi:MAG TPA: hypothetical protein PLL34_00095 [Candidatus Mcinerneyibacteriales bacterium]|nr:hypothetical protein [Candidatus Mcinerneyibacteriales bacterium]HPE19826.1 hypothetical protein [Candidatus Mcinerneyibacteriales bacterium]HPQ88883.1 hypothetical protein [Candidatus Mcinerneyibacteriales bacterium]